MATNMAGFRQPDVNPYTGAAYGAPLANPLDSLANYGLSIPDYSNPNFLENSLAQAVQTSPMNAAVAAAPGGASWFDSMIGTKNAPGWGGMALGAAQGLAGAYMGMQQYGLAKDMFKENKRQFQMNFDAQRKTTNTALEDRQRARVASNAGAYQSVGDYMKENGI